VTPLSWELIEPREGSFDFALVDGLLAHRRASANCVSSFCGSLHEERHVELCAGRSNRIRVAFRALIERGSEVEILSPLGAATQEADGRAYAALMQHLKQVDGRQHTGTG